MGKKIVIEIALDLSISKEMTGVLIRNSEGINISQRFVQGPDTKRLGYRFISDEVLRRSAPIAKLKIMEFTLDKKGNLNNGSLVEGTRDHFLSIMDA